jgi:hypothetical protein
MSQLDPKTLTDDELRKHLITADYLGKAWKEKCLEEVLKRNLTFSNWLKKIFTK